jgi:type II secretory pathway pseudopilin PulG
MRQWPTNSMRNGLARRVRAFTIIELITVVTIVVMVMGSMFPLLATMRKLGRLQAATDTVNGACTAARSRAVLSHASLDPPVPGARFRGAAVIFTPCNEIRIVEMDQNATNGSVQPLQPNHSGYKDVATTEYLTLPAGSAVAGISNNGSVNFLAPPFAIRFDESGQLIAGVSDSGGSNGDRLVCYPDQFDPATGNPTRYPVSNTRTSVSYTNPDNFDKVYNTSIKPNAQGRYDLPFYTLETVIGVVIYDKNDFHNQGGNWGNQPNLQTYFTDTDPRHKNGSKIYLVNRRTGVLLKP